MIVLLLLACGTEDPGPDIVRPVRTHVAQQVGGSLDGVFSGTTEARDAAALSFLVGGTVASLSVGVGDRVEAGQTLARLEATSQALQVEQARAGVVQAQAALRLAEQTLERTEALFVSGSATAADLEGARAQRDSTRAQLDSTRRQLQLAKEQASHTEFVASRAGEITQVMTKERENVGAGSPIFVLTPEQELSVAVSVPERWVGLLSPGDPAEVRLALAERRPLAAHVVEVGGAGRGGAFPVTVELDADHPDLRPGMVAEVHLRGEGDGVPRIELPISAIAEGTNGTAVWSVQEVADGLGRTRALPVEVGELVGPDRVVVEGVPAGTVVVTAGTDHLYEDRVVRVGAP